jgi:SAM-dependent methyltransferase
LARLLATEALKHVRGRANLRVLDPACGDGELLLAVAQELPTSDAPRFSLVGYETDPASVLEARARIAAAGLVAEIRAVDFLADEPSRGPLFETQAESFDLVISNPPYVRTQVMGAEMAQSLAKRFSLTGRVDLYHAFVAAMTTRVADRGVLALLTSNRFMMTRSGLRMRQLLRTGYQLRTVVDLGDSKLFSAAVLPSLVIASRAKEAANDVHEAEFVRSYAITRQSAGAATQYSSVLEPIESRTPGIATVGVSTFMIEVGTLTLSADDTRPWSLRAPGSGHTWLETVRRNASRTFADVSTIRVGIKTTADQVFIRDDWDELPQDRQPEAELLKPLITRRAVKAFLLRAGRTGPTRVLYPYEVSESGRRRLVPLESFERASRYLEEHRSRLESRSYVAKAGRAWYEIWVPQQPSSWPLPKLVFPDISEQPMFALDTSGAVVNGDCYWITVREGLSTDWLWLMLAVANSSLVSRYYDAVMHNKLYSGKRRFITQYVSDFPLPSLDTIASREAVAMVKRMALADIELDSTPARRALDHVVNWAFGLSEQPCRDRDLDLSIQDLALKPAEEREEVRSGSYDDVI